MRNEVSNPRTLKNQGTLGPSLALECKCAFGAKIIFGISFFVFVFFAGRKVRLRRTFVDPKIRVRRQKYSSISQRDVMGRAL